MRKRQIETRILRDEWFYQLTPDEKWFFTYFLISPDISTVGIGQIPEQVICLDTGYEVNTVRQLKERIENHGKIIFKDNWVCIVNFSKHNPMTKSHKVAISGAGLIESLPKEVFNYFNKKIKESGGNMSLNDYLEIKRRNKVKKQLRKQYPNLFGQQLEDRVDKIIGISNSGSMNWAEISAPPATKSDYPTPKSVKYEDFLEIAKEFEIRPYLLYWFFKKKIDKINSSGRDKHDYKAVARDIASSVIGKTLSDDEKLIAAKLFAKDTKGVTLTQFQLKNMLFKGEI